MKNLFQCKNIDQRAQEQTLEPDGKSAHVCVHEVCLDLSVHGEDLGHDLGPARRLALLLQVAHHLAHQVELDAASLGKNRMLQKRKLFSVYDSFNHGAEVSEQPFLFTDASETAVLVEPLRARNGTRMMFSGRYNGLDTSEKASSS